MIKIRIVNPIGKLMICVIFYLLQIIILHNFTI